MQTELQTERLLLKQLTLDYAEVIFDTYAQDPEVCKYVSWTPRTNVDQTREFLQEQVAKWEAGKVFAYAIIRKEDGVFMWSIELRPHKTFANFGYVMGRMFWGNWYTSEALSAILDLWFGIPDIERIYGICDVDNIASAKVMQKVGMRYIGMREKYVLHPNISSEKRDSDRYEIIREKWAK